jgi:hypothetical protein
LRPWLAGIDHTSADAALKVGSVLLLGGGLYVGLVTLLGGSELPMLLATFRGRSGE